jgi:hypothetical protein
MDSKDFSLYLEEQRNELISLNEGIEELTLLVNKQLEVYTPPKDAVKVSGSVNVNTQDEVSVKNLVQLQDWLESASETITKAIEDNKTEAVTEITVKNIKDAKQADIKITNFNELAKFFNDLNKSINNLPSPIVNVEKQDIVLPTAANKPISVRLSDGKSFYNAITAYADANRVDTQGIIDAVNNISTGGNDEPVDLVAQDLFGSAVSGSRYNQVEIDFSTTDPDSVSDLTVTKTVGGDASNSGGQALFTTGTNTNSGIKAVTDTSVSYRPHAETFVAFTAIFTTGITSSYQRIGLYDTNNGFFIGYEGTSFGVTKRSGAVDVTTAKASFSEDTLSGQTGSGYTRNGTPEAIDLTKDNLYRIRFGWLGAAPIYFEVFSPDGKWVTFHKIKHPNTAAVPTIQNPNLPITLDIQKSTAGASILSIKTACWAAGSTSNFLTMTHPITDSTLAGLSRSVIAGRASSGGGTYYNVKVNPSGSLETNATITNVYTKETGSYSICNKEATATYKYFGFQRSDGYWYIMRKTISTNVFEYAAGTSAYSTAWTNRASQTYTDYATAF